MIIFFFCRLSLENNKYQVIKTPIDLEERNKNVRSFLGRSENGVYFAAIDDVDTLWVWILLGEYGDEMEWVPKHQVSLNTMNPGSWITVTKRSNKYRYNMMKKNTMNYGWIVITTKRRNNKYLYKEKIAGIRTKTTLSTLRMIKKRRAIVGMSNFLDFIHTRRLSS